MQKKKFNIIELIDQNCCFDLQFRKDTRRERAGLPTYYRWKVQFVVTLPKEKVKIFKKIKGILSCGCITVNKNQARFSVQKIEDINNFIVPFFTKNKLNNIKKKDFELWQRAVSIIYGNKGKHIAKWKKSELLSLVQIHKSTAKYKNKPRQAKWMEMAKSIAKTQF